MFSIKIITELFNKPWTICKKFITYNQMSYL